MMAWEEDAKQDVILADIPSLGVQNVDPDLAFSQIVDLVDDGFQGTLHISFQDEVKFLGFTRFDLGEQFLQGDLLGRRQPAWYWQPGAPG